MRQTNPQLVLNYLWSVAPRRATNAEIILATGISPHQQVFRLTRELASRGTIGATQEGREWFFWAGESTGALLAETQEKATSVSARARAFETLARKTMSAHMKVATLEVGRIGGVPKLFDFVSENGEIVGDAKYYTLVRGVSLPPAKFSVIAEHVWLLEKTGAKRPFLVFGNDRRVPQLWLSAYGALNHSISFYFLSDDGKLDCLNPPLESDRVDHLSMSVSS
jgi:hypothetical protein